MERWMLPEPLLWSSNMEEMSCLSAIHKERRSLSLEYEAARKRVEFNSERTNTRNRRNFIDKWRPAGMLVKRQITLPLQAKTPRQNVPKLEVLEKAAALAALAQEAEDQHFLVRFKAMVAAAESLQRLQV